jgi:hypothetical protein
MASSDALRLRPESGGDNNDTEAGVIIKDGWESEEFAGSMMSMNV